MNTAVKLISDMKKLDKLESNPVLQLLSEGQDLKGVMVSALPLEGAPARDSRIYCLTTSCLLPQQRMVGDTTRSSSWSKHSSQTTRLVDPIVN